ncbi:DUF2156 domain-containing protein [Fonticella tunisiensis]|uniref:Phosphatidylglycerol lysyltransferase C-terminal domain-containing protein n=1 Tax=Fonticella tunisiensis TaxID=1096341 RepID=A0A4R7K9V9_9CLOT|nr:phosphatidylglycerol lysyltransferase domain-containing protein [Fonticella tunisiensis]TDT51047.1 hypothetical protein EDD71_12217 [Fonticella tunisiensis]
MEGFKPIEIEDRDIFLKYLGDYNFNTYEYSFLTLYLWRKLCRVEYSIIDGALIVKKTEKSKGTYFMQPIGCPDNRLKDLVVKLNSIKEKSPDMKCLFRDVEKPFLEKLINIFGERIRSFEDIDNFDYIYESKKLISLSGRKLHGKKNHYNQFINSYDAECKDLKDKEVRKDCMDFLMRWYEKKENKDEQLKFELDGTRDILIDFDKLNALGMAVYINGNIEAFTIGEKVNKDMGIIHIEKGNHEFRGIYAYINKTFAEKYLSDVKFINREEDLGIEGLRRAKSSYHPVKLEKKYIVELV